MDEMHIKSGLEEKFEIERRLEEKLMERAKKILVAKDHAELGGEHAKHVITEFG